MRVADQRGVDRQAVPPGHEQGGLQSRGLRNLPGFEDLRGARPVREEVYDLLRLPTGDQKGPLGRARPRPAVGQSHHQGRHPASQLQQ